MERDDRSTGDAAKQRERKMHTVKRDKMEEETSSVGEEIPENLPLPYSLLLAIGVRSLFDVPGAPKLSLSSLITREGTQHTLFNQPFADSPSSRELRLLASETIKVVGERTIFAVATSTTESVLAD